MIYDVYKDYSYYPFIFARLSVPTIPTNKRPAWRFFFIMDY